MNNPGTLRINNRELLIGNECNILEIARKAGIEIPTFCYHSELSVYGACRMCLVEIEGRGIVTSCSTPPEAGMTIWTNTREVREIRKINLELLLANHERECTTCLKSGACTLQNLSRTMGLEKIRYKPTHQPKPIDFSSLSLVRNPNKCVLCGDCVRFCDEIQSVGAIDFANRGMHAEVVPAFNRPLGEVECVDCGQCSRVCPTGAIVPRQEIDTAMAMLDDCTLTTVVQVAPAIRVALGEYFDLPAGTITTGKIVSALRTLGFDAVYDTSFTADLTVIEEGTELLGRLDTGNPLPLFTSCCPAWVKFAEQYHPELLDNLSSCRSPQQMFGSLAKKMLPEQFGIAPSTLRVVSLMPCTAKKTEARRPEFTGENGPDIDAVITSQEFGRMIEAAGIRFADLPDAPFDRPFGMASGAGVIFGASGGVTEAVVRFAASRLADDAFAFELSEREVDRGIRELEVSFNNRKLRAAVVYGLRNARTLCNSIAEGKCDYQVIEVMACPGGCINGAGQPVTYDFDVIRKRGRSLYEIDQKAPIRTSVDNTELFAAYERVIGPAGETVAHELLHTSYTGRKRIHDTSLHLHGEAAAKTTVEVCVGTNCCLHGAHDLLRELVAYVDKSELKEQIEVKAAFCFEQCGENSPLVRINGTLLSKCTFDDIRRRLATTVADQAAIQ
jgi:NADH-quinone oxidoreductase subunit G